MFISNKIESAPKKARKDIAVAAKDIAMVAVEKTSLFMISEVHTLTSNSQSVKKTSASGIEAAVAKKA